MSKRPLTVPLAAASAVLMLSALAGCSSDDSGDSAKDPAPTTAAADGPACTYTADGSKPAKEVDLPPDHAAVSGTVDVVLATNVGDLNASLDADTTPCTVNSFVSLARQSYFDSTKCHRLTTMGIYVLQCGDPTGTGMGGPGYSFDDELSGDETYGAGTLAMANAGPGTNGSQFFIVYGDSQLPPSYTVFGKVDAASLKIVEDVAAKGSDNANGQGDGAPKQPVEIKSVTVG